MRHARTAVLRMDTYTCILSVVVLGRNEGQQAVEGLGVASQPFLMGNSSTSKPHERR